MCVCVYVCVFTKLHITAQSGPVIYCVCVCVCVCIFELAHNRTIRPYHPSHYMPLALILLSMIPFTKIYDQTRQRGHALSSCTTLPLFLFYPHDYLGWKLLDQPFPFYVFFILQPKSPPFPIWRLQVLCVFFRFFASPPPSPIPSSFSFPFPSSSPSPS